MAGNPYPIDRELRESAVFVAAEGQKVFGATVFKIWDSHDLQVWKSLAGSDVWEHIVTGVVIEKVEEEAFANCTARFSLSLDAGDRVVLISRRLHERLGSVTQGGVINSISLERELDRIATVTQEIRRDLDNNLGKDITAGDYNAGGDRIRNLGDGVESSDAATKGQVEAVAADAGTASGAIAGTASGQSAGAQAGYNAAAASKVEAIDGGHADSVYGGTVPFDCGGAA